MHGILRMASLITLLIFSACKSSGNSSKPAPNPNSSDPGAIDPGKNGPGTGPGVSKPSSAADPEWASMRNDCGGTRYVRSLLLASIGESGIEVADPIHAISLSTTFELSSHSAQGLPEKDVDLIQCAALTSYLDGTLKKWEGRDYADIIRPGNLVSFSLPIGIAYNESIKVKAIDELIPEMLAPKTFPAEKLQTTVGVLVSRGGSGVYLAERLPIQLKCKNSLTIQYSIFNSRDNSPNSCRSRVPANAISPFECASVSAFTCSQKMSETGECPLQKSPPSLDQCSFIVKKLPVFNFLGIQIAEANLAGFLNFEKQTSGKWAYRLSTHRIELNGFP